jgi:hypothetical protein
VLLVLVLVLVLLLLLLLLLLSDWHCFRHCCHHCCHQQHCWQQQPAAPPVVPTTYDPSTVEYEQTPALPE